MTMLALFVRLLFAVFMVSSVKAQGTHAELIDNVDTYKSLFLENESVDTQ